MTKNKNNTNKQNLKEKLRSSRLKRLESELKANILKRKIAKKK